MSESRESSHRGIGFSFLDHPSLYAPVAEALPGPSESTQAMQDLREFDPFPHLSFTDCLQSPMDYGVLSRSLDFQGFSPKVFGSAEGGGDAAGSDLTEWRERSVVPETPNSSESSSSAEAHAAEEDMGCCRKEQQQQQQKGIEDGAEAAKKANKPKKKGEKREREPRFAFMTKSEVDHLEDGYRWRKYGQKAVKNSSYPRSYYRCTTQNCSVKKRVERSFEDPSIVVTTYEGQHNHPSPSDLRGRPGGAMMPALLGVSPLHRFGRDLLVQAPHGDVGGESSSMYLQNMAPRSHQQFQLPDYGLLQDVFPSFAPRQP